jgi:hypothetical protein
MGRARVRHVPERSPFEHNGDHRGQPSRPRTRPVIRSRGLDPQAPPRMRLRRLRASAVPVAKEVAADRRFERAQEQAHHDEGRGRPEREREDTGNSYSADEDGKGCGRRQSVVAHLELISRFPQHQPKKESPATADTTARRSATSDRSCLARCIGIEVSFVATQGWVAYILSIRTQSGGPTCGVSGFVQLSLMLISFPSPGSSAPAMSTRSTLNSPT